MSDQPTRKLPASAGMATILGILAVYVLTWPIVEVKGIQMAAPSKPVPAFAARRPVWVDTLYWPLHRLCKINHGRNFLVRYRDWWAIIMETPV